jgi:hypothetical protein
LQPLGSSVRALSKASRDCHLEDCIKLFEGKIRPYLVFGLNMVEIFVYLQGDSQTLFNYFLFLLDCIFIVGVIWAVD